MKFSEMPYTRPDTEKIRAQYDELIARFKAAKSADEQIAIISEEETLRSHFMTEATLVSIRNSVNTKDEFYDKENEYIDENSPFVSEKIQAFTDAMLASGFRSELEAHYGKLLFTNYEIAARCFDPKIIPLMQEENKLVSAYQKLYGSALVDFDGKKLPLPMLAPYKESRDRDVRRAAFEADGKFFDEHREEFDDLFDKLVKVRTKMAHELCRDGI